MHAEPNDMNRPAAPTITKLPDHVIRKIAAGEVVERPANVLKELVENSIDSQATAITIEILDGGSKLISVSDNGCGIPAEGLPLAVACHSTSKLKQFKDLATLNTMGFRGEALSAISAVSRFTLKSQTHTDTQGRQLKVDNEPDAVTGAPAAAQPYMLPYQGSPGTTVACEDLFFNVPARRKFLRRQATEFAYILKLVHAMALSHPAITWTLQHNGKSIFTHSPLTAPDAAESPAAGALLLGEDCQKLAANILGIADHRRLIPIEGQCLYGSLQGLITPPGMDYATNKYLFTFVNQRWIQDRLIYAMINRSYQSYLPKGRYPGCVLMLHCEPALVDVNIHPTKKEIKFQYHQDIATLMTQAIKAGLRRMDVDLDLDLNLDVTMAAADAARSHHPHSSAPAAQAQNAPHRGQVPAPPTTPATEASRQPRPGAHFSAAAAASSPIVVSSRRSIPAVAPPPSPPPAPTTTAATTVALNSMIFDQEELPWPRLHYLDTIAGMYWIMADPTTHRLIFVDQHEIHYHLILTRLHQPRNELMSASKLEPPLTLTLPPTDITPLLPAAADLATIGLAFAHTSTTITIHKVPAILTQTSDLPQRLRQLITALSGHLKAPWTGDVPQAELLSLLARTCATAAGELMSDTLRSELLQAAATADFSLQTANPSRIFHILSAREIGRWFERI